jgi:hypothetical protein
MRRSWIPSHEEAEMARCGTCGPAKKKAAAPKKKAK